MHGGVTNSVPEKCAKGLPIIGQTMQSKTRKISEPQRETQQQGLL